VPKTAWLYLKRLCRGLKTIELEAGEDRAGSRGGHEGGSGMNPFTFNRGFNNNIYAAHLAGESFDEIAKKFGRKPSTISKIVWYEKRLRQFHDHMIESEDKKAAKGTWFEIVNALMPHIEAIRAIAESEQPWVKTYIEDRPTYIRAGGEK
jgi:hypothetical protein